MIIIQSLKSILFPLSRQIHRRVLPSHTVYVANMERILSKLWHPSQEEIEQNQLHRLEAKRRYERLKQQRSLRL
jgi:transcriptional adapter 1